MLDEKSKENRGIGELCKNGWTELWQFKSFLNGGGPPSWTCYAHVCTTIRQVFGGIYHCAKFGWNRRSSFNNMQVLVFNVFETLASNAY